MKNTYLLAVLLALWLMLPALAAPPDPNTNTGNNTSGAGGYSGVVSSGQTNNVAYYAATGTTVFGNKLMLINNGALTLGQSGAAAGALILSGSTSGAISLTVPSAISSYAIQLPPNPGTNGYVLTTDGTGITTWQNSGGGGSGGIILPGTAGQMAWYATTSSTISGNANVTASGGRLTLGQPGTIGQIIMNGATSGTATIQIPAIAGTTTFQLPPDTGTNGYVLTTDGTGVTTWQATSGGLPSPQLPVLGFLQTDGTNPSWEAPWNNNSGDYVLNGTPPPLVVHAANITMSSDTPFNGGTTLLATQTINITQQLFSGGAAFSGGFCDANQQQYLGGGPCAGYVPVAASSLAGGNGGGSYGFGGGGGFNVYTSQGSGQFNNNGNSISFIPGSGGSAGMCNASATSVGGTGAGILKFLAVGAITIDGAIDGSIRNDGGFGETQPETTDITIGGTVTPGDVVTLIFTNSFLPGSPLSVPYTTIGGDTTTTIATSLTSLITASTPLIGQDISATSVGTDITVVSAGFQVTTFSSSVTGAGTETVSIGATTDTGAGSGGGGGGVSGIYSQASISYINGGASTALGGPGGSSVDYGAGAGGGGGAQLLIAPIITGFTPNEGQGSNGTGAGGGGGTSGSAGIDESIIDTPTLPLESMAERHYWDLAALGDAQHIVRGIPNRSYRWGKGRCAREFLASLDARTKRDFDSLCYQLDMADSLFDETASTRQEARVTLIDLGDSVAVPGRS